MGKSTLEPPITAAQTRAPLGSYLATKALVPSGEVVGDGATAGKFDEKVWPVMYTLPAPSRPMPVAYSEREPPISDSQLSTGSMVRVLARSQSSTWNPTRCGPRETKRPEMGRRPAGPSCHRIGGDCRNSPLPPFSASA